MRFKTMSVAAIVSSLAASILITPSARASGFIFVDPVFHGAPPVPVVTPPVTPGVVPGAVTPVRPGTHPPRPVSTVLHGHVTTGLSLDKQEISVEIDNNVAKTYIRQTFSNDTDRNLAGTYLFPLPQDATFSSFSLHIDGKPIEGKILAAAEARTQYETIVRQMVDPGLLEYADYKTVRARIFPIPAHGSKTVELEYTQLVKADGGMYKYKFPLKATDSEAVDETNIKVKMKSKEELRTIWSPTYKVDTNRKDGHEAVVTLTSKGDPLDKDFTLYYTLSDKELSAGLQTHKTADEDGYFLLTLNPPFTAAKVVNKDIVLVADTSGSMQGEKMDQAKQALKYVINSLNTGDRFSLVQFNTDAESLTPELLEASADNKKKALDFIDELEPRGGTNLGDAMNIAVNILNTKAEDNRPGYLVLMTDGQPTVGATDTDALLKSIKTKRDVRLFDFGVGYDVNTRLLNKLAEQHHGTSQYVEPDENLENVLSSFYAKIKSPVLSDVKIAYDGVDVKDVYPRGVTDIFAGSPVMLMGRYKGSAPATVRLTGKVNGVPKAYSFPLAFASEETGHTYLPRLWAMRRIGYLTDVAQQNDENKEVVDEIVELSKRYGIISAYTSFLVTDPNEPGAFRQAGRPMPISGMNSAGVVRRSSAFRVRGFVSGAGGAALPATRLGSFVAPGAPEMIFGDEGSAGPAPFMALNMNQRAAISSGSTSGRVRTPGDNLHAPAAKSLGRSARLLASTSHGSAMPSAWAADDFAQTAERKEESASADAEKALKQKDAFAKALARASVSGERAVVAQKKMNELREGDTMASANTANSGIKSIADKTFYLIDGFWVDSAYEKLTDPKPEQVEFGSSKYFELVKNEPGIAQYLGAGAQLMVVYKGHCYKIVMPANVG